MEDDLLYFNGIDGSSGEYLLPPMTPSSFWLRAKTRTGWAEKRAQELSRLNKRRKRRAKEESSTLERMVSWRDAQNLAEAGWGLIFPRAADVQQVEKILEALKVLLDHRREKAGDMFKIFYNPDAAISYGKTLEGYQPGDDKDTFLHRNNAGGPGPVDPGADGIPYYLLIVADPQSIPYEFQFALDTQYAMGRIYFDHLEDYAHYAASLVTAETDRQIMLAPKVTFFGPANPGDRPTQLSAGDLIKPLADHVTRMASEVELATEWAPELIAPQECTKQRLAELLSGGENSPTVLFTAGHGLAWPNGDPRQFSTQGALVCQDWPGPGSGLVSENCYFSARDVSADANMLGMIAFTFACYGAGTPEWDHFSPHRSGYKRRLAERSFLAALPRRLLSLERGGALAVIGHVERAWGYSFKWQTSSPTDAQTAAFKSVLYSLMKGETVGQALEDMNERYTQIAAQLSEALQSGKGDPAELALLWTANNDARGYVVLGDPAAQVPRVRNVTPVRPDIPTVVVTGELPSSLAPLPGRRASLQETNYSAGGSQGPRLARQDFPPAPDRPYTLLDGILSMEAMTDQAGENYTLADDLRESVDRLRQIFNSLTGHLSDFTDKLTTLEVKTYSVDKLDAKDPKLNDKLRKQPPELNLRLHACTHIELNGDVSLFLPADLTEADQAMLPIHTGLAAQAMDNRTELIKAAVEALAGLISPR